MKAQVTHAEVVETVIGEIYADKPTAAGQFRSNCRSWCATLGVSLDDPAEDTLGDGYDAKHAEYLRLLEVSHPANAKARKNVRSAAERMQKTYRAMLASQDLPADFNLAFKAAMDAKGLSPADLNRLLRERYFAAERSTWYGAQIWNFYAGTSAPGKSWKGDSKLLLARAEEVLGLAPNELINRAYRTTTPVLLGPVAAIPYRRARSQQWEANYSLSRLPAAIERIFNLYADWRTKKDHFIAGKLEVVNPGSLWTKSTSAKVHKERLLRFLGWLCLPAPTKPLSEMTDEERWKVGKGMRLEDLKMSHLMNLSLVWECIKYQQHRQHNKVLTKSHLALLIDVNCFVSNPYSFLTANPELAGEFGFEAPTSREAWLQTIEQFHQEILLLLRTARKHVMTKQRNPDAPLQHVIAEAAPYALFLQMIDRLEEDEPFRCNIMIWSIWARDVAVLRMESEVPLRPENIVTLKLGQHLNRSSSTGLWRVFVPKGELKNSYSRHALDINRDYSKETSLAIDRYVDEARKNFVGASESSFFVLAWGSGRKADSDFARSVGYMCSKDTVYYLCRKRLTTYFGEGQGITIFRHVITTSILKDDPTKSEIAAAVLNNSPASIRSNYQHLTQNDGLRSANSWFKDQHGRKAPRNAKDNRDRK